jgi:hypothetical protein
MKRLLLTLMMLVMLTPSLACAKICCPDSPKPSPSKEMPCHHQDKKSSEIKFMKDCAQIDLQGVADQSLVKKQLVQADDFFIPIEAAAIPFNHAVASHGIRAPPRRLGNFSPLPVYLSTQRLRI